MKYKIKQIDKETMIFEFFPQNTVLTLFLEGDFSSFQNQFLDLIDKVLSGFSETEEMTGNDSHVKFEKEFSSVENFFLEEEPVSCTISTQELRTLMDDWLRESKKFKESQKEKAD